jgi:large subunit ribosomal protein L10
MLTRRAAEEAGVKQLLELIDGPTAIAFIDAEGDPAAAAKILNDTARAHDVLVIRGGLLEGDTVSDVEIKRLATLPPGDVVRAQFAGAVAAPLTTIVGLFTAPLRDLVNVLDARITQLQEQGETVPEEANDLDHKEPEAAAEPVADADAPAEEPAASAEEAPVETPEAETAAEEPQAEADEQSEETPSPDGDQPSGDSEEEQEE